MDSNKYSSYYDFSSGRQKRAAPRDPGPNRSVNDFGDDDDLFQALMSIEGISDDNEYTSLLNDIADGQPVQKVRGHCLFRERFELVLLSYAVLAQIMILSWSIS